MSTLNVDKVDPSTGTTLELGTSGDTINIPSGVTIANSGTATGFGAALTGSTNNTVTTVTAANAITGEAKLLFDPAKLTIGNASEEDTSIVFDGHAQDYYIGLDDTDDDLKIGLGSAVGTTAHMVFDETGAILKPLQPAFWVSNSTVQSAFSTGVSHTIEFDTERFDQNADFNTTTYTFTAPVTGRYLFSEKIQLKNLDQSARYYEMQLVTSNKTYYTMIFDTGAFGSDPEYLSFTGTNLVDMDASDTCLCKIYQDDGAAQADVQANSSAFSGYLAC